MNRFFAFFLLSALLFSALGCRTSKKAATTRPLKKESSSAVIAALNQIEADWFEGRAQISYDDGAFAIKTTANIRMRKDSIIWMSVKKLGFEVARIKITSDSIFVLDRINNQFVAEDITMVEREYNFPANLNMLQAIILGNPVFFFSQQYLQLERRKAAYLLSGSDERSDCQYWIDGVSLLLQKMHFEEPAAARKLQILQDDYRQATDNQKFSYFRSFEVNSRETGNVSIGIDFSKVDFNIPKSIRFEIPSRYTRASYD